MEEIVNKVAQSRLVNLDLADFYPKGERVLLDIKDFLWQEAILKEKEFREQVKTTDWTNFSEKYVAIFCSVDAIVPVWAYMLIASQLHPHAKRVVFGNLNTLETTLFMESMNALN